MRQQCMLDNTSGSCNLIMRDSVCQEVVQIDRSYPQPRQAATTSTASQPHRCNLQVIIDSYITRTRGEPSLVTMFPKFYSAIMQLLEGWFQQHAGADYSSISGLTKRVELAGVRPATRFGFFFPTKQLGVVHEGPYCQPFFLLCCVFLLFSFIISKINDDFLICQSEF